MNTVTDNSPVHICFIAPKAYPLFNPDVREVFGGAEIDLYLLATKLAKDENFAVSFVTADYGQKKTEVIQNVKIIKSLNFNENSLTGAIKVWQAMRIAGAKIYLQETASLGTFLIALFCRLNKRVFIYRTAHQLECDGTYLKQHYFAGKAFRWSLHNAAQVIVQNQTDKEALEQTTSVHSTVIPNAHHLPMLPKAKRDFILWVGRSAQFKRPEFFIELAKKMPGEHFAMICQRAIGDENYNALLARAGKVENLQFIERVPFGEIDSYFQRAKMFINTSDSEGFPNTFIQACKYATPILSLCVNPDNFLSRYECGLCANDNWDKFVQQFKILLNSEKNRQYGQNARRYAEQHHNIEKIAEKYKNIFSKLASST